MAKRRRRKSKGHKTYCVDRKQLSTVLSVLCLCCTFALSQASVPPDLGHHRRASCSLHNNISLANSTSPSYPTLQHSKRTRVVSPSALRCPFAAVDQTCEVDLIVFP